MNQQRFGFGCGRGMRRGLGRYFGGAKTWSKNDLPRNHKALGINPGMNGE